MNTPTAEEHAQRASLARQEGRLADARRDAREAVVVCREAGTPEKLVRALMLLGQIERDSDQPAAAIQHYQEAVDISRSIDQPLRFAHTVRHLADLHCDMGELKLADACYRQALDVYRSDNKTTSGDLANAIRGFAVVKDAAGASDEARSLWQEARDLYATLGVTEGVKECDARLGAM